MRIAIYSRKSIETDTGESIKNQIAICKRYFERENEECKFEIFEDEGFSGGNTNRPDFKRMMELVKAKQFDAVAVYKIDRIARNIVDFVNTYDELEKLNVKLVSVTEGFDPSTPIGKMMMMLLASFAEMERMNIAQRVKDNMKELAKLGRWSGGTAPTGYTVEKIQEDNKTFAYLKLIHSEANNIREIFLKYSQGYTAFDISKYFECKGVSYKPQTIYGILTNPTYLKSSEESIKYLQNQGYTVYGQPNGCGFLPYNRRPRKNGIKSWKDKSMLVGVSKHETVVDLDLWILVQEQLEKKTVEPHPHESQFSFLTGGIMKCKCGGGLGVAPSIKRKDGTRRYYFICRSNRYRESDCKNLSIRVEKAEKEVEDFLQSICDKKILSEYVKKNKKTTNIDDEIKAINKKISENKKAMDSLIDKLILLSNEAAKEVAKRIEEMTKNNNTLKEELLKLERERLFNEVYNINIDTLYISIKQFLNAKTLEDKRRLIKLIVDRIVWDSDKNELQVFLT
ncbi:recombinase family protein [Clostridium sp. DJ247]|uniref:recombinase family protein n=1 Tax=Clostridium sp. DJ247 TaxID=2726188 RepID=UPI001624D914|nr:recombinase family protein [Clostridium sp. DJ247]MBC2581877.1 recombinase family protein [Clostridium sp. DJ247]